MVRVLVADAQCIVRMGIMELCREMQDYTVVGEASSAVELFAALESTACDLLVVDPDLSGGEEEELNLIGEVGRRYTQLPILAFSLHNDPYTAKQILAQGALGYLSKDCGRDTLGMAIRRVAGKERFVSPDIVEKMLFDKPLDRTSVMKERITKREMQVMRLFSKGMSVNEIAAMLHISNRTVSTHKARVMQKMHFRSHADLYCYAIESGLAGH